MKRLLLLSCIIGLFSLSVVTAKDHVLVNVSIDETINPDGLILFIHSTNHYCYVAEVTNEVIIPYVDELVKPTLDGYGDEVFHPPVNRPNIFS